MLSLREVWENFFTFIFQLSGWAVVVPSCSALHCHWFLLSVSSVTTEWKKSIPKARYGKHLADGWWGVGGSSWTTKHEQLAFLNRMHVLHVPWSIERHHVGATLPQLYSPRLRTNHKATKRWYGHTGCAFLAFVSHGYHHNSCSLAWPDPFDAPKLVQLYITILWTFSDNNINYYIEACEIVPVLTMVGGVQNGCHPIIYAVL